MAAASSKLVPEWFLRKSCPLLPREKQIPQNTPRPHRPFPNVQPDHSSVLRTKPKALKVLGTKRPRRPSCPLQRPRAVQGSLCPPTQRSHRPSTEIGDCTQGGARSPPLQRRHFLANTGGRRPRSCQHVYGSAGFATTGGSEAPSLPVPNTQDSVDPDFCP